MYAQAQTLVANIGAMFKPPRRTRVSKAVEEAVMIATPGGFAGNWSGDQTPYMVEPMDLISSREHTSIVFAGPARTGKSVSLDTPIPTPTGWTTMGDLEVGDMVLDADGKPTRVSFVTEYQYERECYSVNFSDGTSIVADADHNWGVERFYWKKPTWRYEVRTTKEMLQDLYYSKKANGSCRFRYHIRNTKPLELPEKQLPLDPYLLGLWLGDGDGSGSRISCHSDDATHYVSAGEAAGYVAEITRDGRKENASYVNLDKGKGTFSGLLIKLNLRNNKHVPDIYLRASHAQRLRLAQGLMDSDGHSDNRAGSAEFTTTSDGILAGIVELLCSLGLKPKVKNKRTTWVYKNERKYGTAYRVTFPITRESDIFALPRKRDRVPHVKQDIGYRQIVSIEPVTTRPVRCIQVESPSHLFLAGRSMIPTHNTQGLIDGGIGYIVTCDPSDILVVHMTEEAARRYSRLRIKRMLNNSPMLKERLSTVAHDDNVLGKYFKNGTALILAWPSPTQLSAQDYKYVFLSDYDRMPDDTGEGDVYTLASKRTQTFMSGGMTVVESSPGRDFLDRNWQPTSIFEAPPVGGILGLYNSGDRRMWHWNCIDCGDPFPVIPGLDLFALPEQAELMRIIKKEGAKGAAARFAKITCPCCGVVIEHKFKNRMNLAGFWKAETDRPNSIASFWLGGAAAKFQTWVSLLEKEFLALEHFESTGEETKLKATRNTDQGIPYMPAGGGATLSAQQLESRAEDLAKRMVPAPVRFIVAAVDVQASKFVVQMMGYGVGLETWVIDRFDIAISERESHGEMAILDPAGHKEDWDVLIERVIQKTYPLDDDSGRSMRVIMTTCDSGGREGVTENAYHFWKRTKELGLDKRFALIKGERPKPTVNKPMVSKTSPDKTSKAARNAKVTNVLPLWILNTTQLKDAVAANLKRADHGADFVHFPDWLPLWFYEEITAEQRTDKGWENISRSRNETFDLLCYAKAGYLIKLDDYWKDKINWENPPGWAEVWDNNSEVSNEKPINTNSTPKTVRRVRMRTKR